MSVFLKKINVFITQGENYLFLDLPPILSALYAQKNKHRVISNTFTFKEETIYQAHQDIVDIT